MKKLLLVINFVGFYSFVVVCQEKATNPPAIVKPFVPGTLNGKTGNTVSKNANKHTRKKNNQKNNKFEAIDHSAPNQHKIDSIKNGKIKSKK